MSTGSHQKNRSRTAPLNPGFFSLPGNYLLQFRRGRLRTQGWGSPYLLQEAKPRPHALPPYFPLANNPKQPSSSGSTCSRAEGRETTAPRMHGAQTIQLAAYTWCWKPRIRIRAAEFRNPGQFPYSGEQSLSLGDHFTPFCRYLRNLTLLLSGWLEDDRYLMQTKFESSSARILLLALPSLDNSV